MAMLPQQRECAECHGTGHFEMVTMVNFVTGILPRLKIIKKIKKPFKSKSQSSGKDGQGMTQRECVGVCVCVCVSRDAVGGGW